MNLFSAFEDRVSSLFGETKDGVSAPVSFKKLAKKAVANMRKEKMVLDGITYAPNLYTILISLSDDALMRSVYPDITRETTHFIEAKAVEKNYQFLCKPLVRFMVDPNLKSGKFAVFVENIEVNTLEKLRQEESAFLNESSSVGGAALVEKPIEAPRVQKPRFAASVEPAFVSAPHNAMHNVALAGSSITNLDAGLEVMPDDIHNSEPMPAQSILVAPPTERRPMVGVPQPVSEIPVAKPQISCMLIDRASGKTYTNRSQRALIGRERSAGSIVLQDSNVSRRHAELFFENGQWHIKDLGSTNGTLVNDVDIDSCILQTGDIITLGLVNLEFRED